MKKLLFATLLFVTIFFLHCKEPELSPNTSYQLFPLDLKAEKLPNGDVKYTWNPINVSGFEGYVLIRSSNDSVPYFSDPTLLAARPTQFQLVTNINEAKVTEFIDSTNILPAKVFYRLFAIIDGRVLSSINVPIQGFENIRELNVKSVESSYSPKLQQIALTDLNSNSLFLYDLKKDRIDVAFRNINFMQSKETSFVETSISNFILVPSDEFNLIMIDLNNFNDQRFVFNQANNSIITHKQNDYIVGANFNLLTSSLVSNIRANNPGSLPMSIFVDNDLDVLGARFLRKYNNNQKFCTIQRTVNTVKINTYSFLENGTFSKTPEIAMVHNVVPNSNFSKGRPFTFTNDDAHFIVDMDGSVYSTNGSNKKIALAEEVPTDADIRYADFAVNNNTGDIYALRVSSNGKSNRKIDVFSYPSFTFKKSINYRSAASRIYLQSNKLILVSLSTAETPTTILEYIDL